MGKKNEKIMKTSIFMITLTVLTACNSSSNTVHKEHPDARSYLEYMKVGLSSTFGERAALFSEYDGVNYSVPLEAGVSPGAIREGFSSTNVQELGVDESDFIKFDGDILLTIVDNQVFAYPEETLNGESSERYLLDLGDTAAPFGMLSGESHAAVISGLSTYDWGGGCSDCLFIEPFAYFVPSTSQEVIIHTWKYRDAAGAIVPDPIEISMDGNYIDSRAIGNKLYVISGYRPRFDGLSYYPTSPEELEANQEIIDGLSLNQLSPQLTINGESQSLVSDDRCQMPEFDAQSIYSANVISITVIDMTDPSQWKSQCILGSFTSFYASFNNMYLTRSDYESNEVEISQFSLNHEGDDGPSYVATGRVSGSLSPSYNFGEVDGKLVFVNTDNNPSIEWGEPNKFTHKLSVFEANNESLEVIAQIPNAQQPESIGKPGEWLYAVRILGERAYVVTFDKVDPLYVIDLSDTQKPEILGQLEIPGFSSYLHPISQDLILGIGKNAKEEDGVTWYQGLNVRLFDTSDPSNPIAVTSLDYGYRGSYTPASNDPHSFAYVYDAESQIFRFAFPMSLHGDDDVYEPSAPARTSYSLSESGLYQFEVNMSDPELTEVGRYVEGADDTYSSYHTFRSVLNGDNVYFLNDDTLDVLTWAMNESERVFDLAPQ